MYLFCFHFYQVQKKVRNKSMISQRMHGHTSGQMPTDTCTFRDDKKLYLFPGYNPADHQTQDHQADEQLYNTG